MGFFLGCGAGVPIAQSLLHGDGCQSGRSTEQAACELVPALAETRFPAKRENALFERAFKCFQNTYVVLMCVLLALPYTYTGNSFCATTGLICRNSCSSPEL